jgi:hypothetical protein
LLFTSCVSSKKYAGFVRLKPEPSVEQNTNNALIFDLSKLGIIDEGVRATKLKSQFIPALLFWQWKHNIQCQISPQSVGILFQAAFIDYAKKLGLFEKLGNRTLAIKPEALPATFVYTNEGYAVMFIVAYAVSQREAIYPDEQAFVVTYAVQENGQAETTAQIRIANKEVPVKNIWRSTKKFTQNYTAQFENNIELSAQELVAVLLDKL